MAGETFQFYTRLHLSELTGLKAKNLEELVLHARNVPGSVIYHHTHHFLQQHLFLSPEPPNDFAYWVTQVLGEKDLGEALASVNVSEFPDIRHLRDRIVATMEDFLAKNKRRLKEIAPGEEFHFMKTVSFVLPTPHTASTLSEFASALDKVTSYSIYYHMFEARLRLDKPTNDFSLWLESALGETALAKRIASMDPYTVTIEGLRERLKHLVRKRTQELA